MPTVNDVKEYLFSIAPPGMKADFDNVGFLVGRKGADASNILVSLDITSEVISEAHEIGAGLIVSHHPVFLSLRNVTDEDITGRRVIAMLSGGISAICMHTNLDAAHGGVNDALAAIAGIKSPAGGGPELLSEDDRLPTGEAYSYGRVGCLENPCSLPEYLKALKKALHTNGLRYFDAGREVYKVAVASGSGGDMFDHALRHGCDTFLTADIKYNLFLQARELGMNLIDGDHYCTENVVTGPLADKLSAAFPQAQVYVSKKHTQTVKFY